MFHKGDTCEGHNNQFYTPTWFDASAETLEAPRVYQTDSNSEHLFEVEVEERGTAEPFFSI